MGADRQTDGAPTNHGICPRCLDERLEALSEAPPAGRRALGLVRSRPPGGPALRLGKKSRGIWLAGLLMWVATGCAVGGSEAPPQPAAPNLHWGYPAMPGPGLVNVVVEIPAGTNAKWQVAEDGSSVEWESMNGEPRVVAYLAYPASYGMIPGTFVPRESGGDGDPLDAILLGPALERGTVAVARPIGVLFLSDDGERDDKVLGACAVEGARVQAPIQSRWLRCETLLGFTTAAVPRLASGSSRRLDAWATYALYRADS